ncbi:MAG: class I SAM-dependent methyltransferase, partial [bacterium]|nr:class I SAM-dependent methyltransferase [bacterium]
QAIKFRSEMRIMDFGCGTGLIARELAPKVASVTAVDTSLEMVAVLKAKTAAAGLSGIEPLLLDNGYESGPVASYDAIVSSMVLHHIEDISGLVAQLAQWCRPSGWIGLADLEPEDGTFHRPGQQVAHHGIDPTALASQLKAVGFVTQSVQTVHTIQRPPEGQTCPRDYPVFLLVAQRAQS